MKRNSILFALFFVFSWPLLAQSPVGIWKSLDDTDGQEKSHIEITEHNGVLTGKVIKLLPAASITRCDACKGANKGKSIEGMTILWDLKKNGKSWDSGQILDPKNGKIYSCKAELEGADMLKVRGFLGISLLGRTQTWYRIK